MPTAFRDARRAQRYLCSHYWSLNSITVVGRAKLYMGKFQTAHVTRLLEAWENAIRVLWEPLEPL